MAGFNGDDLAVRALVAASREDVGVDYARSLLLAVEAVALDAERTAAPDGTEPQTGSVAARALVDTLQYTNRIDRFLHADPRSRRAIEVSPDGRTAVAGSDNGTVAFWDLVTDRFLVDPINAHNGVEVRGIAIHPDRPLAASGGEDGLVVLWDLQTGEPLGEPLEHNAPPDDPQLFDDTAVPAVAFSNDGTLLASADRSGKILVWDLASRNPISELQDRGYVLAIDFSPDDQLLATAATIETSDSDVGTLTVWQLADGSQLVAPGGYHQGSSNAVEFNPDGTHLMTCSQDTTIAVFDLAALTANPADSSSGRQWSAHTNGALDCTWTDGGASIISVGPDVAITHLGDDVTAFFDNAATAEVEPDTRFEVSGGILAEIGIAADGRTAVVAGLGGDVAVLDLHKNVPLGRQLLATGETIWSTQSSGPGVAISSDGSTAAAGKEDGRLWIWDLLTGEVGEPITAHTEPIWHAAFTPDDRYVLTGASDTTIGVWDPDLGSSAEVLRFAGHLNTPGAGQFTSIYDIAFSPDGENVASCDTAGGLVMWRLDDGAEIWRTQGDGFECTLTFSGDGRRLYWTQGTSLRVVSGDDGSAIGEPLDSGHTEPIFSQAIKLDDETIYTGGRDSNIAAWDGRDWTAVSQSLARLPQTPHDLHYVADVGGLGPALIATVRNGDVLVIDPDDGAIVLELLGHGNAGVWRGAYSSSTETFISADFNGVVIIHDLQLETWIDAACRIAGRSLSADEWSQVMDNRDYPDSCATRTAS